jgi:DNA-binding NarL/FixJ family response regulator
MKPYLNSPPKVANVVVVDDDEYFSHIVKVVLERNSLIHVVKQYNSGFDFLEHYHKESFDLVILDFEMPRMNGLELVKEMRKAGIEKPIISFSAHTFPDFVAPLYAAGVTRCLQKAHLKILEAMILKIFNNPQQKTANSDFKLNAEEVELLLMICEGFRLEDIGNKLNLSAEAIKKRKSNLAQKLCIENYDLDFLKWAIKHDFYVVT